jgi:hypothetical protein
MEKKGSDEFCSVINLGWERCGERVNLANLQGSLSWHSRSKHGHIHPEFIVRPLKEQGE